ncbi:DUF7844 domain-containing protein [Halobacteriovorax marinus]|nr:DUF4105 domain-containing protein [Halobacteriovorax marinus]
MNIKLIHIFCFLILSILSSTSSADIFLNKELKEQLQKEEIDRIHQFISETLDIMPDKMIKHFGNVELNFTKVANRSLPKLSSPQELRKELWAESDSDHSESEESFGALAYTKKEFFGSDYKINLHNEFLPIILDESQRDLPSSNNHKTMYQVVKATLVHELSHVFDLRKLSPEEVYGDDEFWRDIREFEEDTLRRIRMEDKRHRKLQLMKYVKYNVSNTASFRSVFKSITSNNLDIQSPDNYEFVNAQEAFAVNMEYFLLDSEYKCRKPALYNYLSKFFVHDPFPEVQCMTPKIRVGNPLTGNLNYLDLDPSRIYQIHYLFAGEGKEMMSKWGHAMLRVVMCSPEREEVSEKCLEDIKEDIVISYRASITGGEINYVSGITGKYPSVLYTYGMPEIITEYTIKEDRELFSIPIQMSKREIQNTVDRIQEGFWSYTGKYKFVSNNCATETFNFLKSVFFNQEITLAVDGIVVPGDIISFLHKYKRIKSNNLDDYRKDEKNFYSRYVDRGAKSFESLQAQQLIDNKIGFAEYYKELRPQQRASYFNGRADQLTKNDIINFLRVENIILQKRQIEYDSEVNKLVLENFKKREDMQDLSQEMQVWTMRFSPYGIIRGGYGVPYQSEVISIEEQMDIFYNLKNIYDLAFENSDIESEKSIDIDQRISRTKENRMKLIKLLKKQIH